MTVASPRNHHNLQREVAGIWRPLRILGGTQHRCPQFAVEVHPLATDEAEAAERWYRDRKHTAAARFRRELDRVVDLIAERPEAAPPHIGNTRRFLLRWFPFFVVYRVSTAMFMSSPSHTPALLHLGPSAGVDAASTATLRQGKDHGVAPWTQCRNALIMRHSANPSITTTVPSTAPIRPAQKARTRMCRHAFL